jgi:methyl-accepting chemotaxis protein
MFSNMKIGLRLGLGFGLVVILLVIIATLAILRLSQQNDTLNLIVNDRYMKVAIITVIKSETTNIAMSMRNMLLTENPDDQRKQEELISDSRKKIQENIEKLQKVLALPKGKELLQNILD